jgi:hypothetical protein
MLCNSPCPNKQRRLWLQSAGATALGMALHATGWANMHPAPLPASHPAVPGSVLAGGYLLRFFGLQVYDARLWVQPNFDPTRLGQQPLVLELKYLRGLKGRLIAERSLKEMRRHGNVNDAQAERWLSEMTRLFPDVGANDKLTGILQPGLGAIFLFNDQPQGQVADPEFARLFFSIWLGSNTSEPAMRAALLGERR